MKSAPPAFDRIRGCTNTVAAPASTELFAIIDISVWNIDRSLRQCQTVSSRGKPVKATSSRLPSGERQMSSTQRARSSSRAYP